MRLDRDAVRIANLAFDAAWDAESARIRDLVRSGGDSTLLPFVVDTAFDAWLEAYDDNADELKEEHVDDY